MKKKVMSPMFSKDLNQMMKTFGGLSLMRLALLFWFSIGVAMAAAAPFTIVVKTDNPGTSTTKQFTLPLFSGASYNFTVNWGDSTTSIIATSTSPTHTYAVAGTYTIQLTENVIGGFPRIYFSNAGDRLKLLQISKWGGGTWSSMTYAFLGCSNLTISATDAGTALTGMVTDFTSAWDGCISLTSFPLLNTAAGTSFSGAWSGCSGLTTFPLLNTAAGTKFSGAWAGCTRLTTFPLLNTAAGKNFNAAWQFCSGLKNFPLLNTAAGTSFYGTWQLCSGLTAFPQLNTDAGMDFTNSWSGCSSLTTFPILNFAAGTNFTSAWYGCTGLTSFPLVNVSVGTNFSYAWYQCTGLTSFPLVNVSAGTNFSYAWYQCSGLTSFSPVNFAAGTNFNSAWSGCTGLTSFPLVNVSAGTNFSSAWAGCRGMANFPLLNTAAGTNFSGAWYGCSGLTTFPLLNTAAGTNFSSAWYGCTGLTTFPLLNTAAGTNFSSAWYGCAGLTTFPLLNTAVGTNFSSAWAYCRSMANFPLLNTAVGTNFSYAWQSCSSLTSFPILNTAAGTDFSVAWAGCNGLTSFPILNTAAGTNFSGAWESCRGLTSFPSLNTAVGSNFSQAWYECASLTSFPALTLKNMSNGDQCFWNVTLPTGVYSAILVDLAALNVRTKVIFGGSTSKYNATAISARNTLTTSRGWIITDGGLAPNSAPTVVIAASASPNPVIGTTTTLSVLGADDGGEATLTYTWAIMGTPPATVAFSANGNNAAKSSTATFTKSGSYAFRCTIQDSGNLTAFSLMTVTVNQTATIVAVTPPSVNLVITKNQSYSGVVKDQFGTSLTAQPSITWSPASVTSGSLSATGLFTANTTVGGPFTLTATSGNASGTATMTVVNAAPTVATAAAASSNLVAGTTTSLSVFGADDGGEATLTYTWATMGTPPASVAFSANGANVTKNTTATFTAAGSYIIQCTITDVGNLTVASSVTVTVSQTATSVAVTPASANVVITQTQQYSGVVKDQFGAALATQPAITWSPASIASGTLSSTGLFTPNTTVGGPFTLTATSGSASGTATVTVVNAAPTVATAAAASPNPVTGATTTLSVLGADDGGETALTYTWATTGTPPAAVTFGANGSNAAKSSTATFTVAGSYTFQCTIKDSGNLTVASSVIVAVNQTATSVAVTPASANVVITTTKQYTAIVNDQFGAALSAQPVITWSPTSVISGTMSSTGLFTANTTVGGPYTLTATGGSLSNTATVTVVNAAPTVATAAVASPNPVIGTTTALSVLGADDGGEAGLTYMWATTGTPPATVAFSANGNNAAKSSTATFTAAGSYIIQCTITDAGNLTVASSVTVTVSQTATSVAVTPASANVVITQTQQYSAIVKDQFGTTLTEQPAITWSPASVTSGSLSAAGSFTANTTVGGPFTLTAASGSASGTAMVTVVNAAPTVATAAAASAYPVTSTTTALSVLGADDGGETGLTYTWTTTSTPPATVAFSANGTNATKNTTATFTAAGSYIIQCTITDAGNLTVASSVSVTVNQTATSVAVTPASANVVITTTQPYSAIVKDQFGTTLTEQPSITWSPASITSGTLSSFGLFIANTIAGGPYTLTATGGGASGSATVTVIYDAPTVSTTAISDLTAITATSGGTVTSDGGSLVIERGICVSSTANPTTADPKTIDDSAALSVFISTLSGLTPGTTYHLRAYAINSVGTSYGDDVVFTTINSAPIIVNAALANPGTGTGTTVALSVLGADDGGEAALTYTWAIIDTPPAAVRFSDNGTNAAKSSIAIFTASGSYILQCTITDAGNLFVTTDSVSVTVVPSIAKISLYPATISLPLNGMANFSATAVDQFDQSLLTQPAFTWASTAGTVTGGSFMANTTPGAVTVSATSGGITGTAQATIQNTAPTIAQAPAAQINDPQALSELLSVLGSDDGGESNLTYTWTTVGAPPARVTFDSTVNGTNLGKSMSAFFTKIGTYSFQVTIKDTNGVLGGLQIVSSTITANVLAVPSKVVTSPKTAVVALSETQLFQTTVSDQFGAAIAAQAVTWSVNGGGTISASGLFTAGATVSGPYNVVAQLTANPTITDTSLVTVVQAPLFVSQPLNVTVQAGQSATFAVVVSGIPTPTLQWYRGRVAIPGAIGTSIIISQTVPTDNNSIFKCIATNSARIVSSSTALLSVLYAPKIITQPVDQQVVVGQPATFNVIAEGYGQLTYQWSRSSDMGLNWSNWSNISGATQAQYTISTTASVDNYAVFLCTVKDSLSKEVESSTAILKIKSVDDAPLPIVVTGLATLGYSKTGISPESVNGKMVCYTTSTSASVLVNCSAKNANIVKIKVSLGSRNNDLKLRYISSSYTPDGGGDYGGIFEDLIDGTYEVKATVTARNELTETSVDLECPLQVLVVSSTPISLIHLLPRRFYPIDDNFKDKGVVDLPFLYRSDGIKSPYYSSLGAYTINATNEAINATMRTYFQKPFYNIDDIGGLIFSVSGGCDIDSTQLLAYLNGGGGGTLPSPIVLSVGSNDPDAPTATSSTKYRIRVNGISEELKRLNSNKGLSYFSVSVRIQDKAGNKYFNPHPAILSYNETERQYSDISGYLSRPGRNSAQWYSDLMGLRMTWNRGDFFSADTNARGGRYESPQIGSLVIGSQAFESYFDWGNTDVKGIDDFGIITNRTIDTYPEGTYNNIHYQRYIDQQFKFNKLKDAGQIYADNVKWIKGSEYGYSYTEADFSGPSSPVIIDIPPKSGRYYIGRKDGVMSFMEHPDYSNLINRREAAPYEWPQAGGRYDNTYRDTIGLFQTNLTHRVHSEIQISPIDVQAEAGNSGKLYVSPGIITLPPTWSRIGAQDAFTKVRIYDKPKNMGLGFVGEIFLKSASDILRADSDFTKLFEDFYGFSTGAYADVTDFGLEGTISLLQPSNDGFNIRLSPGFGSLMYRYSQLSYSNYRNTVYQNSVAFWLNSINLSPDNAATGTKKTISVNAGFLTPDFRVTQFRKNGDYVRFLNGGTDVTTTSAQYGIDGSGLTPEQLSQRIVITDQRIIHDHIDTWVKQRLELDLLIGSNVQPGLLDVDVNFGAVHAYTTSELDDAVKGSTFNGGASHRMLKAFAVTDLTTKMVFLQDDNTLKEDSSIQVQGDMRPGLSVNIDDVKFSGNNMTVNLSGTIFDRLSEISKGGQEIKKIQVYLNSETLPEWDIPIVYTAGTSLLKRTMQRQFNSSFTIDTQFDRAVCISVVVTNAAGYMAVASAAESIAVDVIRSDAPPSDVENMAKTPDPQPANIVEEAIAGDVIVGFARTTLIDPTTANSFPIVKPTLSLDGQALSIDNKYVAEIEAAVNDNKAKNSYIPLDANGDALPFIFRGPGAADLPFGASVKVDYWFWENISNATIKFDGKIYGKTEFEKEFNVQIYQYTPPADINEGVNAPKRRFVPCTMEEISGALVLMQNPSTAELISNFKLSGDVFPIGEVTDNFLRNAPTLPNSDRPLVSLVLDDTKSGLEVGGPNSATDYIIHVNLQARWTLRTRYRSPEEIATDVIEQLNAFIEAQSKNVYYIRSASSYMSGHGYSTVDFSDDENADLLVGLAIAELRKAAAANIRTLGDIVSGAASLFNPGIGFSMVLNDASEGNWTSVALSALPMLKVLPAGRNGLKKLTIKNKSGTKLAEIDQELITKLSGLKKPGSDAVDDLFALANRIPEDEFIKLEEGAQKLVGGAICTIGCFSQGTMIHTENGLVAIERLRPGDKILSYNEVTGSTGSAMVESNDRRFASSSIIIGWSQGPAIGRLRSTAEHPYLRVSEQGQRWVEAGELQVGDQVRTISGLATITFIEACKELTPIYSLVIFSNHTFAVGDAGIIVHNGECAKALIKAIKLKWGNTGYEKFLLECPQYILNKLLSAHGAGAWNEVIGASVRAADKNKHELIPCRLIWNYILPILGKANGITRKELNSRRKKYIQMIYALRVPIDDLHFNAFKVPGGEKGFDAKGRMIGHTGGKLDQFVDREGSMNQFHNLCETAFIKSTANDGGFNVVQYKAALMENAEKFFRGKQLTWWRQQTEAMANEAQILWIAP